MGEAIAVCQAQHTGNISHSRKWGYDYRGEFSLGPGSAGRKVFSKPYLRSNKPLQSAERKGHVLRSGKSDPAS